MWWYKCIFAVGLALLTACQWSPVYEKPGEKEDVLTTKVQVEPIAEEIGRVFRRQLENDLNPNNVEVKKLYSLHVELSQEKSSNLGIVYDNTATLVLMHMSATYQLTEISTKKKLDSGLVQVSGSYNILRKEPYATVTAEESTKKSLALMLADQLALRVAKTLQKPEK